MWNNWNANKSQKLLLLHHQRQSNKVSRITALLSIWDDSDSLERFWNYFRVKVKHFQTSKPHSNSSCIAKPRQLKTTGYPDNESRKWITTHSNGVPYLVFRIGRNVGFPADCVVAGIGDLLVLWQRVVCPGDADGVMAQNGSLNSHRWHHGGGVWHWSVWSINNKQINFRRVYEIEGSKEVGFYQYKERGHYMW